MHLSTNLGMGKSFELMYQFKPKPSIFQIKHKTIFFFFFFRKSYGGMFKFVLYSKATLSTFSVACKVVGSLPCVQFGWFVWLPGVAVAWLCSSLRLMQECGRCRLKCSSSGHCCSPEAAAGGVYGLINGVISSGSWLSQSTQVIRALSGTLKRDCFLLS